MLGKPRLVFGVFQARQYREAKSRLVRVLDKPTEGRLARNKPEPRDAG